MTMTVHHESSVITMDLGCSLWCRNGGIGLGLCASSARGLARLHCFHIHGACPCWPHCSLPVVCSPVATTSTFSSYRVGPNFTICYHCAAAVPFATTTTSRATTVFLCYHCYFKSYCGLSLLPPLLQKLPQFSLLPPLIQELPWFPPLPLLLQGLPGFFSATTGVIPYINIPH